MPIAPAPKPAPPVVPADLRHCFNGLVEKPDAEQLPVDQVEKLWKVERKRSAAKDRCGARLLLWIDDVLVLVR